MTTSGKSWGRGPVQSDIHGGNKRERGQPGVAAHQDAVVAGLGGRQHAARSRGSTTAVKPMSASRRAAMKKDAAKTRHEGSGGQPRRRPVHLRQSVDDLRCDRNWISFNLDGIWGGNMYAGGAGAILPNKITSKHNIRYVPNMKGPEIVEKIKKQLIKNGYRTWR